LIGTEGVTQHYQTALGELHRELRRPMLQRSVFSFAQTTPREIVRSRISVPEIQQRALSFVPDHLLTNIPEDNNEYSLFQGFQATIPEEPGMFNKHGKHNAKGQKMIGAGLEDDEDSKLPPSMQKLKKQKNSMSHQLDMMGVRKRMCVTEIHEIDNKIANLNTMRKMVLDRLAGLEYQEAELEQDLLTVDNDIEDLQEELDDAAALAPPTNKEDSRPTTAGSVGDLHVRINIRKNTLIQVQEGAQASTPTVDAGSARTLGVGLQDQGAASP
jgi:division protein 1